MSDDQFGAEQLDEDVTADDEPVLSDEVGHWRPTVPVGVPFADSDVTDESLADRVDRSERGESGLDPDAADTEAEAADEQLTLIVDTTDAAGDDVLDGRPVDDG